MDIGLILLVTFSCLAAIQLYFYLFWFTGIFKPASKSPAKEEPVSVILCARNNRKGLEQHLSAILNQRYKEFEVIVVNDGSTDESKDWLDKMDAEFERLKVIHLDIDDRYHRGKKFAQTIGIKAAKHPRLIFTDTDCEPVSEHWIREMSKSYSKGTEIVLGVSNYKRAARFLNWLIQLETFHTALLYVNFALKGRAYMGVGRNLSYQRELFFKVKGFASHQHLISGDDDLFVNETATQNNVSVCLSPEAMTISDPPKNFSAWYRQKMRHFSTGKRYRGRDKFSLGLYYFSLLFFYLFLVATFFFPNWWQYAIGIFGLRLMVQAIVLHKNMKALQYLPYYFLFPFMDLGMLFIQIFIGIRGYFSKPLAW